MSEQSFKILYFISLKNLKIFSFDPLYLKCTCPVLITSIISVLNPPLLDQNFADLHAAATTELSSVAIGIV